MVSDRKLGVWTTALFGISTLAWLIAQIAGMALILTGAVSGFSVLLTAFVVIGFIARYGALIVGVATVFRTNRWEAGTGWLVTVWIITCWYALLFVRDLILLAIVVFAASMGGGSGEAIGYSSIPSRPPL